ncbi:hypothetical protein [Absidia glauca]|uniref:Mitochondrial genome maintenance protein MGM101 n=1 Tax=Absidia glauca TaxID=4829 RepID=A0A163JKL4_ABSGL|nr:hypothetical protein [Absidia glauca]
MRFVQLLTKAPSLSLHQRLMTTTTRYAKPAARTFTRKPTAIKKADDTTPPRQNESFSASKGAAAVSDSDQQPDPSNETAQYFPAIEQFDTPTDDLLATDDSSHNWSTSFFGLSTEPFSSEVSTVLQQELNPDDVEIKPDGLLYLPEIKYRRILNKAFGPGGWGLAPRGDHSISNKNISREYALICHGRFVSQARGEQDFFDTAGLPTASEGCKSNALMRCC